MITRAVRYRTLSQVCPDTDPGSQIVENDLPILQKFLDPDPEADDFLNLMNSSLSTDTSVVKFFIKISSVVFT